MDGLDGASPVGANLSNVPIEQIELEYPIVVEEYAFLPDSGGPGKHRGCLGIVRQVRFLGDSGVLSVRSDRRNHPPYGLAGGLAGQPSANILNPGRGNQEVLPTKFTRDIRKGDVMRHVTAGGGGFGPASLRSRQRLEGDTREGKITKEHALTAYGIDIPGEPDGPTTDRSS